MGGALVGRPRWTKKRSIECASWTKATMERLEPHRSQVSTSSLKTRIMSSGHEYLSGRERDGGSWS